MSIFMRKIPKAAIALLCLLAVFTWLTLSPMTEAQAVAVVDDLTIWGLIALLSGWGVSFAAKDATKTDLLDTMRDLIDKAGVAAEALTEGAAIVASPGILKLRPSLVAAGAQVVQWLKAQVGSSTGNLPVVTPTPSNKVDVSTPGETIYNPGGNITSDYTVYTLKCACNIAPYDARYQVLFYYLYVANTGGTRWTYYNRWGSKLDPSKSVNTPVGRVYYAAAYTSKIFNSEQEALAYAGGLYHIDHLSGTTAPDAKLDAIVSDFAASNFEIPVTSDFSFDADLTDAAAPTAEPTAPVYVTAPGLTYDTPAQVADSWYDHVTADPEDRTYPVTQAVPNIIDAAAIQSGAGTAEDIDPDLDPVIGLVDVFPFCIPFDIYNFLALFNHTREAPSVTIPLALPEYIGGTQEITIDLSSWEPVARILRTVELIAFIVGLAFETRKFIKW